MKDIKLRPSVVADINNFFEYQLDEDANYLAAFTATDPTDKKAYLEKYTKLLSYPGESGQIDHLILVKVIT